MDALHVVFLGLAVAAFGLACWLFVRGSRAAGEAALLRALSERAEAEASTAREEVRALEATLGETREALNARENEAIELRGQVRHAREVALLEKATMQQREQDLRAQHEAAIATLREEFANVANRAVQGASQQLTQWAQQNLAAQTQRATGDLDQRRAAIEAMVKPVAEALQRTDAKLAQIDKDRAQSQTAIEEQLRAMRDASGKLGDEARRLSEALRKPDVRGRYGEMQLRRVAELAGMVEYCDFATQVSSQGGQQRPDMVVTLPSGRRVIVDAKTNIGAYLEAVQAASPDEASRCLDRFAEHVSQQAIELARKEYWKHFEGSPEFVVMFVPGDQFVDAALSRRPDLLEVSAARGVILASPATLIGLLRAVAVGYREEKLAKAAEELRALGRQFHERVANVVEPLAGLGEQLEQAIHCYNRFVGSYETRLLPTLQKFEESGVMGKKEVKLLRGVVTQVRPLAAGASPAGTGPGATGPGGTVGGYMQTSEETRQAGHATPTDEGGLRALFDGTP